MRTKKEKKEDDYGHNPVDSKDQNPPENKPYTRFQGEVIGIGIPPPSMLNPSEEIKAGKFQMVKILETFSMKDQNTILRLTRQELTTKRTQKIKDLEKEIDYIRGTLNQI